MYRSTRAAITLATRPIYLHRPPPEDRDAAFALLDETAAARRA
jgi:hypothetical protein